MSRPPRDVGSFRGLPGLSDEVVQRLEQLRELVQRSAGTRGTSAGLLNGSGTTTNVTVVGGGGAGGSDTPDLTPPPTPTGVVVTGGLTYVFIEHDAPTFTMGHGYGRTRVYGATYEGTGPLPTFDPGSATPLVHEFVGQVGSFSTNPATEWHLWVTWVSADGVESAAPSGGTNGHVATTGQDVGVLLELLTGQITESHLYAALGAKIAALDPEQLDSLGQSLLQTVTALRQEARDRVQGLSQEASARADALLVEAAARGAAITQMQTILQAADASLAQQITTLTAAVTLGDQANASAIQNEAQARADGDTAEAQQRGLLAAQVADNDTQVRGLVEEVSRASADADHAEAEQRLLLLSTTHTQNQTTQAAISLEQQTRTEEGLAEATKRETLAVTLTGLADPSGATLATLSSGLLAEEKQARVTQDTAQVQRLEVLEAKVDIPGGTSISSILTAYATLATLDSSQASQTTAITAAYQAADAGVLSSAQAYAQSWAYSKAQSDSAEAAQSDTLRTEFQAADATVYSNAQTWVQTYAYSKSATDSAIATQVNTVSARLNSGGDVSDAIVQAQNTASAKNATFRQSATPTATRVGDTWIDTGNGNLLKAWTGSAWVASDDSRIGTTASSVTTLQSQVAGSTASGLLSQLQTEATTRATETGSLFAQYTVKTSVAGLISGYGLASTANTATPTSIFGVQANQFYVGPPHVASSTAPSSGLYKGFVWLDTSTTPNVTKHWDGAAWTTTPQTLPFIIQTTPTTINGVAVPAGVYMDTAFIRNGTITNALIGTAAIDDAKIANLAASKLIAGSIAVGEYIQSSNYVANTSGWRIHGNGTAELQTAVVRGAVYASSGTIGGINIGSSYIQSTSYSAGSNGFRFNSDGTGQLAGIAVGQTSITSQNFDGAIDSSGNITNVGTQGWALSKAGGLVVDAANVRGKLTTSQIQIGAVSDPVDTAVNDTYTGLANSASQTIWQATTNSGAGIYFTPGEFAGALYVVTVTLELYVTDYDRVGAAEIRARLYEAASGASWSHVAAHSASGRVKYDSSGTLVRCLLFTFTFSKAVPSTDYGWRYPAMQFDLIFYDSSNTLRNPGAGSYVIFRSTGSVLRTKV